MKKFFLIVLFSLVSIMAYTQLSYDSGFLSTTYFDGNDEITYNKFKSKIMENDRAASNFKISKTYSGVALGMSVIGLVSTGLYLSDTKNVGFLSSGLAFTIGSLLFSHEATKKLNRAIEIRNGALTLSYKF